MTNAKWLAITPFPSHSNHLKWKSNVTYFFFSLLQMRHLQSPKLYNIHFFSALTLGLKKDDIVFIPVLSTLARVFWAAVIFLGGWNKEGKKINMITQRLFAQRQQGIHCISWTSIEAEKKPQGKRLWPICILHRQSLKKAANKQVH